MSECVCGMREGLWVIEPRKSLSTGEGNLTLGPSRQPVCNM